MLAGSNAAHDKKDCDSGHSDRDDEEIDPATVQVVIARFNDTHPAHGRLDLIHIVGSDSNSNVEQQSLILRTVG